MKKTIIIKISIFMVITFILSIVLALLQESLNIDYQYVTFPQWGPGLAALVLSFTMYPKILSKSSIKIKYGSVRLLSCLLLPFILIGLSYYVSNAFDLTSGNEIHFDLLIILAVIPGSLFGAIGEALGWRRFLQSSVDKHFNYIKSAVIIGLLWGLWHVGNYSNGPLYMISFLIFTMSASLIMSILIRKYHYNLVFASIFHLSTNLGFFIFFRAYLSDINMMFVNALIWLMVALAMLYFLREKEVRRVSTD